MTAKEYLLQIRKIDRQLKALLRERKELDIARTYMQSPQIVGDRVQTSPSGDPPWMKYLIKWGELTEKIGERWDELICTKKDIEDQINTLDDDRYIDVLTKRYIELKSFEKISVEMHYEYGYTRKIHKRALDAFSQIMTQKGT